MAAEEDEMFEVGEEQQETAESLFNLSLNFCVGHLTTFCKFNRSLDLYCLNEGIHLPADVSEALINRCRERGKLDEALLHVFADPAATKVQRLNLNGCSVRDRTVRWFAPHKLTELNISNCSQISNESLRHINKYGDNLLRLLVGNSWGLFIDAEDIIRHGSDLNPNSQILNCPKLKVFSVHGLFDLTVSARELLSSILQPLKLLNYLDLSGCRVDVDNMNYLENMEFLTKLILYDVPIKDLSAAVKVLRKLRNLRALDLSQGRDGSVVHKDPENHLRELVSGLPYLNWLDMAGTNLPGFIKPECVSHRPDKSSSDDSESSNVQCAIPGLEGRQFQFLGLMDCPHGACDRENIPAKEVTGNSSEEQIYLSVHVYIDKPSLLCRALNHLFSLFRFVNVRSLDQALQAVLLAMKKHPRNGQVQTLGCACLVFIIKKGMRSKRFSWRTRQKIIMALLDGMDNHKSIVMLVKRGCLAMSYFDIPRDLIFVYERVVHLMLWFVERSGDDQLKQICLYLLKYLSSQVEISHKEMAGNMGAISAMMDTIRRIVQGGWMCDQIMLRSWSILWSLTDMSPLNCEKFLIGGGIELFLDCCYTYPEDDSLTRKMVGMMCNVAEVPWLRSKLMQNDRYVRKLVECLGDHLMISNSAAGVLSHLIAENPCHWVIDIPSRNDVKLGLKETIKAWDIESRRNVRYRSFVPMLTLFSAFETPESQHWATWEVCNMIKKDPERYVKMFTEEGGLPLVEKILEDPRPYGEIKTLARMLVNLCHQQGHLLS